MASVPAALGSSEVGFTKDFLHVLGENNLSALPRSLHPMNTSPKFHDISQ